LEWDVLVIQEKLLKKPSAESKHSCFKYCVGAFPGNTEDWWIKDFWYIYCNIITNYYRTPEWGRMMGSTPSSGSENYHMVGERMCIENLFLNNFMVKVKMSLCLTN
jgi:hypothetical protein